jgi:hypothetical protein
VLDVYHRKNKKIKPPNFNTPHSSDAANFSRGPADGSRGRGNSSYVGVDRSHSHVPERVPAYRSHSRGQRVPDHSRSRGQHVPAHRSNSRVPDDRSRSRVPDGRSYSRVPDDRSHSRFAEVQADRSHSRFPERVQADHSHVRAVPADRSRHSIVHTDRARSRAPLAANLDIANLEGPENDDDKDNTSDNGGRTVRAARNSKPLGDPKSSQLNYYSGIWYDILVDARNSYRKLIHTTNPFPERNADNLTCAHNLLLDTIGEYVEKGKGDLDECNFFFFILEARSQLNSCLQ